MLALEPGPFRLQSKAARLGRLADRLLEPNAPPRFGDPRFDAESRALMRMPHPTSQSCQQGSMLTGHAGRGAVRSGRGAAPHRPTTCTMQ